MKNKFRKGIILAGGQGTRLYPITIPISKQLIPVYDKPMIYYPLSTLMMANIRDILIITNPEDKDQFKKLLGDGSQWNINIEYKVQLRPEGLAQAFLIGESFIGENNVALALGDNIFHGDGLINLLRSASSEEYGADIFIYPVKDPERYGVAELNADRKVLQIEEKPKIPKSNYGVTGIYFYDNTVIDKAKSISPSKRGELEITDINNLYLKEKKLRGKIMGRGMTWLDTGTYESLSEASSYIRTIENRQGLKVGCPEEIAFRNGWIEDRDLVRLAENYKKSGYGNYLLEIVKMKY
ncbi:glucose-1-phosphate thymidylyltransferase [Prochlorococcus sp. HOT_208_60]|nr:glucose-1-phosphate thymidylyltransferase [Prochlorococcus sp. HOT_208_60]